MPLTVFMVGHGAWRPKDGFFQLPSNCSFSMVVDVGKVLHHDDQTLVCAGVFRRDYARVIGGEGSCTRTCPNLTWQGDEEAKLADCRLGLSHNKKDQPAIMLCPPQSGGGVKLSEFFKNAWAQMAPDYHARFGEVHFVWNCCSYAALNASWMGADIGMNAVQRRTLYQHFCYAGGAGFSSGRYTDFHGVEGKF